MEAIRTIVGTAIRWPQRHRRWAAGATVVLIVVAAVAVAVARRPGEPDSTVTGPPFPPGATTTAAPTPKAPGRTSTTAPATTPAPTTALPSPPATASPGTPAPAPGPAIVVYRGDPSRRAVALTFDAGSDAGHAGEILDILAANRITATFGITGTFAESYPEVVARVARAGHQIVNHSDDHPSFTGFSTGTAPLPTAERTAQLQRAEAAIRAAAGVGSGGWFRPPYGDIDDSVERDAVAAGWPTLLMWTVDSLGWKGIGADAVVARCLDRAEPGAIYLFHVGRDADDAAALQRVVDGLRAAGYGFDTAAGLIA